MGVACTIIGVPVTPTFGHVDAHAFKKWQARRTRILCCYWKVKRRENCLRL